MYGVKWQKTASLPSAFWAPVEKDKICFTRGLSTMRVYKISSVGDAFEQLKVFVVIFRPDLMGHRFNESQASTWSNMTASLQFPHECYSLWTNKIDTQTRKYLSFNFNHYIWKLLSFSVTLGVIMNTNKATVTQPQDWCHWNSSWRRNARCFFIA